MADPNFPAYFVRATNKPQSAPPTDPNEYHTGEILRHQYSKVSAWNADGSLLHLPINRKVHLVNGGWELGWLDQTKPLFLDGSSYRPRFSANSRLHNVVWERWSPLNNPNTKYLRYYARNVTTTSAEFGWWDVLSGQVTRLRSFADLQFSDAQNTESNPSDDGRYVALAAKRPSSGKAIGVIYEVYLDEVIAEVDLSAAVFDNLSISSLGTYMVVNGCFTGASCYLDAQRKIVDPVRFDSHKVYSWKGQPKGTAIETRYFPEFGRPSHFDFAVDQAGEEVIVGTSKCDVGPECISQLGSVIKRRLRDGVVTRLTPKVNGDRGGFPSHTSTRNLQRPGWAYVTYMRTNPGDPGVWGPYFDEVAAVKLDGSLTVQRLFRTYNTSDAARDYWTQAQAVPSPDGRRVIFTSNWQNTLLRPTNVALNKTVLSRATGNTTYTSPETNLTDGKASTIAYPALPYVDYEVDLGSTEIINRVEVLLDVYGTESKYISSWSIEGIDASGKSVGTLNGGFPGVSSLVFDNLNIALRKIRFRAQSSRNEWFGVAELRAFAQTPFQIPAASYIAHPCIDQSLLRPVPKTGP